MSVSPHLAPMCGANSNTTLVPSSAYGPATSRSCRLVWQGHAVLMVCCSFQSMHHAVSPSLNMQVEFYFSDTNLPTDKHMLKQIAKDPDGFGEPCCWMVLVATLCNSHASLQQQNCRTA